MARKYNVEGTKSFLIAAAILLAIGVWHIRDGWFPAAATLEKHPPGTDTFYLYNRVTGVILTIAAAICGYIHRIVK